MSSDGKYNSVGIKNFSPGADIKMLRNHIIPKLIKKYKKKITLWLIAMTWLVEKYLFFVYNLYKILD